MSYHLAHWPPGMSVPSQCYPSPAHHHLPTGVQKRSQTTVAPPVHAEISLSQVVGCTSWVFLRLFAVVNSSLLSDTAHIFSVPCSLQVATSAHFSSPGYGMSFLACAALNHPDLPSGSHLFSVWFMSVLLPGASLSSSWEGCFALSELDSIASLLF